jgi:Rrf2 family iron-sulfur cluster assembly transcriptional regulator
MGSILINKSLEQTINTLIDIIAHTKYGAPVKAVDISKRLNIGFARIQLLLSTLKSAALVQAIKGRDGGYLLAKEPHDITITDIFSAVNETRSRKIFVKDLAKDTVESLENYFSNRLFKVSSSFSEKNLLIDPPVERPLLEWKTRKPSKILPNNQKQVDTRRILITKAETHQIEKLGPNSIFEFSNYI